MDGATSEDSIATSRFETDTHEADQAAMQQQEEETIYACAICLQTATHPVASTCGHLFCWECLFAWLRGHPGPCPMCRTTLIQGVNIFPIFTGTADVDDECPAGEPHDQSNTANAAMNPRRPPPPSPDRIRGLNPLPSRAGEVTNTVVEDMTPSNLEQIVDDLLADNFEISRERVDSLEQSVEELVQWGLMLRQQHDRNVQLMDLMNRRHAREIAAIHRQYAEEMDGVRHIHTDARD